MTGRPSDQTTARYMVTSLGRALGSAAADASDSGSGPGSGPALVEGRPCEE